jgi:hypothetical protein
VVEVAITITAAAIRWGRSYRSPRSPLGWSKTAWKTYRPWFKLWKAVNILRTASF